jgi:hypothetical protein
MATPSTLADPTNYGNEPGEGPLRVGGVATNDPKGATDLPSTLSKSAARQAPAVKLLRDLWAGMEAIRQGGRTYLPIAFGEDAEDYRNRLARSVYFNAFRRTVEALVGLIFRKDPVLGDDVPAQILEHWEDIDLEGTHGDVFCRTIEEDAMAVGHAAILVDYPRATGMETRAQEQALGLRPYWVPIKKENILSWRVDRQGGQRILRQVVLREATTEPVGEYLEKDVVRYRVLVNDDTGPRWELLSINDNNVVMLEDAGYFRNQHAIPLSEVKTSGSASLFDSNPPLLDLGYLNIAHYQQWSDYAFAIHKTNVPFLFLAGVPEARDENGELLPIETGPNSYIGTSDPQAKAGYVSHDGAALGASKQSLDDLKADMGTLGLQMLAPQKRAAETAKARQMDKSASDSALSVSARALQDAVENALQFHANYLREPSGGSIEINRDFEGILMEAPVMSAYAQLVNAGFPARAVLGALQRGGRIPEDEDLDELEVEWLMGRELDRQIPNPDEMPEMEEVV